MNEYMKQVTRYKSRVYFLKEWLKMGLISKDEYLALETKLCEMCGLSSSSIYRENEWI